MIFAKTNLYGLDAKIYELQEFIENELPWLNTNPDVHIYGKIYPNPNKDNAMIPEAFCNKKEYKQIFVDDNITATIGFYQVGNRAIDGFINNTDLEVICTVDLGRLFSGDSRDDERALMEFVRVLRRAPVNEVIEVKEGIPAVFSDFFNENIKFNNMQDWYVFSVRVNVEYEADLCATL